MNHRLRPCSSTTSHQLNLFRRMQSSSSHVPELPSMYKSELIKSTAYVEEKKALPGWDITHPHLSAQSKKPASSNFYLFTPDPIPANHSSNSHPHHHPPHPFNPQKSHSSNIHQTKPPKKCPPSPPASTTS